MDWNQLNKSYKAKKYHTTFPPATPVPSKLVLYEQLAVQRQAWIEQHDTNNGSTFSTQKDNHHQPQRVTSNKHQLNATAFEIEYQDFAPLKCAIESFLFDAWEIYTKHVTDNLIMPHLQK